MSQACRVLGVPVISGNVSLYNETAGRPIYPTPVVGALGVLNDVSKHVTPGFKAEGDLVYLIGPWATGPEALAGSEYLSICHEIVAGRPAIDLDLEARVQVACLEAIDRGLIRSAHDCSDGGLAVALAECCIIGGLGLDTGHLLTRERPDALLFGETPSRIVVSVAPDHALDLETVLRDVSFTRLGQVGGDGLRMDSWLHIGISQLKDAWELGLEQARSFG